MLSNFLIEKMVKAALEEDLAQGQDVTALLTVPATARATGILRAREPGILAGLLVALSAFSLTDADFEMSVHVSDSAVLEKDQVIAEIEGPAQSLLTAERTALNFLNHMSGIATLTRRFVQEIEGTNARICDTRKTLPGLRAIQKYAVTAGGGYNHRFGLGDAVLIKDNHIALAGGVKQALDMACEHAGHMLKIEIEVDTLDQIKDVLNHGGADVVMLDNMDVKTLRKAVDMAKGKILTEASGGVSLSTVRAIAEIGVDYISIGALTHSAPALDIGLDINNA